MSASEFWRQLPQFGLAEGDVLVWQVALDGSLPPPDVLQAHLTAGEKERAARFRFAQDRQRYAATRAALRRLLGALLAIEAAEVRLRYGAQGKPFLHDEYGSDVQFNVAHSHEVALIALARGMALGVDVEYARSLQEMVHLARRFFSAPEVAALEATDEARRRSMFFRIWSRKEAFIKATGKGLSQPLDAFDVMAADGRPLTHVALDGAATPWQLWDLAAGPDYGAALVVWTAAGGVTVRQRRA